MFVHYHVSPDRPADKLLLDQLLPQRQILILRVRGARVLPNAGGAQVNNWRQFPPPPPP